MVIKFEKIEWAYEFVSSNPRYMNEAFLCIETGKIYYHSGFGDSEDFPDDLDDEKYISIPHKNDLDLGRSLVLKFVEKYLSENMDKVKSMFSKAGAYARFKNLLERENLAEQWYAYEAQAQKKALYEWCKENAIQVSE